MNLRETITPKSDQLNADDLIGQAIDITVTGVKPGNSPEQPVSIHYECDNGRPYKPCKSMRRVLIACWSDDGAAWVGRSMRLYADPEVKFGGIKVGGIRISHLTDIDRPMRLALTVTRSKRAPYTVEPLHVSVYSDAQLAEKLPAVSAAIKSGKMTVAAAIQRLEKTAKLTPEQMSKVQELAK